MAFLFAIVGAVFGHADEQGDGEGIAVFGSLRTTATGHEVFDNRMVDKDGHSHLPFDELDEAVEDAEGVGIPGCLGVAFGTLGGLGGGVGVDGGHGVPLSLA